MPKLKRMSLNGKKNKIMALNVKMKRMTLNAKMKKKKKSSE